MPSRVELLMAGFFRGGVWTGTTPGEGLRAELPQDCSRLFGSIDSRNWSEAFSRTSQTLWVCGHQFLSGYFLRPWGNVRRGKLGVGGLAFSRRYAWRSIHLTAILETLGICFLMGAEKAGC